MTKNKLFQEYVFSAGNIIWLITAAGFLCSLAYNYGYFECGAAIKFLSLQDILKSYSLWIPGLIAPVIVGYGINISLKRAEKGLTEEEIISTSKYPTFMKYFRGIPEYLLWCMVVVEIPISYFLFGFPYSPVLFWVSFFVIWSIFSTYLLKCKPFVDRTSIAILVLFITIVPMLAFMFALGLENSPSQSKFTKPNVYVYMSEDPHIKRPMVMLRNLENGLLCKNSDINNYVVLIWSDIAKVETIPDVSKPYRGMLCERFGIWCKFADTHKKIKF